MQKLNARLATPLVILSALVLSSFLPFVLPVQADQLSGAEDTISDSRAGVSSTHTFVFTTPSTTAIKTIDFQYCTSASGTCTAPTGMVLTATPTLGTVTGIAGTGYAATGTSATCTGTGNTDCTITLTVTTPSAQSVTEVTVPVTAGITNPTSENTTTFVRITTKDTTPATIDTATVAFATLTSSSLTMTATVDPTFSFSLSDVTTGTVNSATVNVTSGTSASTIPFGTLSSGSTKIVAHDVTVTTNATSGYLVTVKAVADPPLADGSNNLDYFTGTNGTPSTWSSPAGSTPSVNTGFVGYTTQDDTLTGGTADRFTSSGGNKWAGLTTTADPVISSSTGVTSEIERIGWQAEVNNLQPAGSYSGTAILVATPTY